MATYGPGIDQSQHTKSVSHIIKWCIGHFLNHAQNAPSCMEARLRVSDGLEIFPTWRITQRK